jgi:hypothetical protein
MPATSPAFVKPDLPQPPLPWAFSRGSFHRGARLTGLNLLLTYSEPCAGRCAYSVSPATAGLMPNPPSSASTGRSIRGCRPGAVQEAPRGLERV